MPLTREDKLFFSKHLATLIKAGVPLSEALSTLYDQSSGEFKKPLKKIIGDVENGQSLGKSMSKFPKIFDSFFVSLVSAGEASGTLDENLVYLSRQQEKDLTLRKKIGGALLYPSLVVSATLVMGLLLSWFVLPSLVDLFTSLEADLPISTKILLWFANLMKNNGVMVVAGIIGVIVVISLLMRIKPIKKTMDGLVIRLPVVGKLALFGQLGLFSRNLSTLLSSGLPVVDSLTITSDTLDNLKFRSDLEKIKKEVTAGKSLYESMTRGEYFEFSGLVRKMIEVGEKTGKLEEMLDYLADYYEEEIGNISKNLSSLLEPVLLLLIGGVVAFVAMAIISPIYSLMGSIN